MYIPGLETLTLLSTLMLLCIHAMRFRERVFWGMSWLKHVVKILGMAGSNNGKYHIAISMHVHVHYMTHM